MFRNKKAILLLAAAVFLLTSCDQDPAGAEQTLQQQDSIVREGSTFSTTRITRGRYLETVALEGNVIYFNSIELYFSEDNATFSKFYVESGDYVKEGQKIAECKVNIPEMEIKECEIAIEALKETLQDRTQLYEKETADLKRKARKGTKEEKRVYELLLNKKELEYQKYKTDKEKEIGKQEELLNNAKTKKSSNILYAPMDGIIDKLGYMDEGDSVDSEQWIVMMHSENEDYICVTDSKSQLYENMTVMVKAGTEDNKTLYEGYVVQADNVLNDNIKSEKAYIALKDSDVELSKLENILVYGETKAADDVLIVDHKAVYTAKGKKYVVLLEDGVAKKRYITVGLSNADYYCILSGAEEGWEVVIQ